MYPSDGRASLAPSAPKQALAQTAQRKILMHGASRAHARGIIDPRKASPSADDLEAHSKSSASSERARGPGTCLLYTSPSPRDRSLS
eukprot:4912349-Pyramimonas_sp.AAC.1